MYKINLFDLYFNPYRNYHADSLVGITLLDLFNDYFNRYWNHPRSLFSLDRVNLELFSDYPRRNLSVLLSILFIFYSFKKSNKYKLLYLIGLAVLTLTAFGFFGLHFNPGKGDTVKTHYYFFLIAISFIFITLDLFNSKNFWINYSKTIFLLVLFIFIFGFPKIIASKQNHNY